MKKWIILILLLASVHTVALTIQSDLFQFRYNSDVDTDITLSDHLKDRLDTADGPVEKVRVVIDTARANVGDDEETNS
jgi:hypothetical protein